MYGDILGWISIHFSLLVIFLCWYFRVNFHCRYVWVKFHVLRFQGESAYTFFLGRFCILVVIWDEFHELRPQGNLHPHLGKFCILGCQSQFFTHLSLWVKLVHWDLRSTLLSGWMLSSWTWGSVSHSFFLPFYVDSAYRYWEWLLNVCLFSSFVTWRHRSFDMKGSWLRWLLMTMWRFNS